MNVTALVESRYWAAAGWTMLNFAWIGALAGLACAVMRRTLARRSPSLRYLVALAALIALALAPIPIFLAAAHETPTARAPVARTPAKAPPRAAPGRKSPPAGFVASGQKASPVRGASTPKRASQAPSARPTTIPTPDEPQMGGRFEWIAFGRFTFEAFKRHLPWLWLLGAPCTCLWLAAGMAGAERLRKDCQSLEGQALGADCRRLARAMGVARKVALAVSHHVVTPVLVGCIRPMILLPPSALAMCSPDQLEMILLHELAHVRRWDNLVNLGQRFVESVLFFHPVVWWLSAWVRLEREFCCDAAVLAHTARPREYAETLAALAIPGLAPRHTIAAMADRQLVVRIHRILNVEDSNMKVSRKSIVGLVTLVVTGACFVALHAQQPPGREDGVQRTLRIRTGRLSDDGKVQVLVEPIQYSGRMLLKGQPLHAYGDAVRYTRTLKGTNWGTEQATGAPDTFEAGDHATAWASLTPDDQDEWLELTYAEPVEVAAIMVYENCAPGALYSVTASVDGNNVEVWRGEDPTPTSNDRGVSVIGFRQAVTTNRVKLHLASTKVPGWNEIDAAGLIDTQGRTHWAVSATASSSYGETYGATTVPSGVDSLADCQNRIAQLEQRVQALEALVNELRGVVQPQGPNAPPAAGAPPGVGVPGVPGIDPFAPGGASNVDYDGDGDIDVFITPDGGKVTVHGLGTSEGAGAAPSAPDSGPGGIPDAAPGGTTPPARK